MFVKSDPECSGSDLTKRFVIDEEDIISQLLSIQSIMFILFILSKNFSAPADPWPTRAIGSGRQPRLEISLASFTSISIFYLFVSEFSRRVY